MGDVSKMRKILKVSFILFFLLFASWLGWGQGFLEGEYIEGIQLIKTVLRLVQEQYVEEVKVKDLAYGAIRGILAQLDPHSQFLTPEIYQELLKDTAGEYSGIGIVVTIEKGYPVVVSPIEDTPAYRVGLLSRDKIVEIDGQSTKDITLMEVVKKLRGKEGTQVKISISREGEKELLEFTITREIIKIKSVKSKILKDNIVYLRIAEFSQKTAPELEKNLKEIFKTKGLKGMILDLRSNPGGLLHSAIEVARNFIGERKLIVYTQGRYRGEGKKYYARKKLKYPQLPLVVLVNQESASGAEIVAGALKDWHRGIILGERTFGKASVQSVLPLPDGSAIKLTTAKYFTPRGKCIQQEGIKPDIEVILSPQLKLKLRKRNLFTTSEKIEDPQLQRAIDILKSYEIFQQQREKNEG
jgi:carboxyl-terminal processing protease